MPVQAEAAQAWYLLAAERGYQRAQLGLGRLLLKSDSPLFDPAEGVAWIMLAAAGPDNPVTAAATAVLTRLAEQLPQELLTDARERARVAMMRVGMNSGY